MPDADGGGPSERWQEALSLAARSPSPPALTRQRRRRTRVLVSTTIGIGVAVVAGVILGALWPAGAPHHHPSEWRAVAGLVCSSLGLVATVVGTALLVRSGQFTTRWTSPMSVLDRSQRRAVVRQVHGRAPVLPQQVPLLLDHARRVVATRRLLMVASGAMVCAAGQLLSADDRVELILGGVVVVSLLVVALVITASARSAERFLTRCSSAEPLTAPGGS